MIVSDFPQAMQGEIRVSVVLMPSRRHRVEQDARRGGTPAVLDLETVEIQEAEHVLLGGLPVDLHGRVLELRPVNQRPCSPD